MAGLINLMGAYLGPQDLMLPSKPDNPKGYWERWDIFELHNAILRYLHLGWDCLSEFDIAGLQDEGLIARFKPEVEKIMLELEANRPWLIKDPRINILLPFWLPLLDAPVCINVYRNPLEIAKSLQNREGFDLHLGLALWEQYTLLGLAHSAGLPRLMISYHDLMSSPFETIECLHGHLNSLGVNSLRMLSKEEILTFVDPSLHRQKWDHSLLKEYANPHQLKLNQAFIEDRALQIEKLPGLSLGALEAMRFYETQMRPLIHDLEDIQKQRKELKQKVHDLKKENEIAHQDLTELNDFFSALSNEMQAIFESLTWKAGNTFTNLAMRFMLRKPDPGARGQIERIFQEVESWQQSRKDSGI